MDLCDSDCMSDCIVYGYRRTLQNVTFYSYQSVQSDRT